MTRFTFVTTDADAIVTPFAKKSHGIMPAQREERVGDAGDRLDVPPTRLKKTVKTKTVSSGCRTAQATPSAVCL